MAGDAKIWGPHDDETKERVRKGLAEQRAKYGPSPAMIRREMECAAARAALLEEVLEIVGGVFDEIDFIVSEYVESTLASNYMNDALSGARERLATLSPAPPEE